MNTGSLESLRALGIAAIDTQREHQENRSDQYPEENLEGQYVATRRIPNDADDQVRGRQDNSDHGHHPAHRPPEILHPEVYGRRYPDTAWKRYAGKP